MVGFQAVIQVFHLSVFSFSGELAFPLQFQNGGGISRRLVGIEFSGERPITEILNGFSQKPFGGFGIASMGQVKVNGMAVFVDSAGRCGINRSMVKAPGFYPL